MILRLIFASMHFYILGCLVWPIILFGKYVDNLATNWHFKQFYIQKKSVIYSNLELKTNIQPYISL